MLLCALLSPYRVRPGRFTLRGLRDLLRLVSQAIEAASDSIYGRGGGDFREVLFRAFPEPTPEVRGLVEEAEASDEPGYEAFADTLIGSLHTMHRCMRIAYEEREVWLLELLEGERQSIAAASDQGTPPSNRPGA